jgi:DHA1 family bicyclomycin/chloramphenicol resistance-like MFS transporter
LVLPTTFKPDTSISLKPKPIITNFLTIIKEPQFYTYAFAGSIAFSGLFTHVALPILFMDIFKLMPKPTVGYSLLCQFYCASQLNSFVEKYSSEQMILGH